MDLETGARILKQHRLAVLCAMLITGLSLSEPQYLLLSCDRVVE